MHTPRTTTDRRHAPTILTVSAFTLGTGEIMIAGLLPDIAADTGVSLPTAGLLVSAFPLAVALAEHRGERGRAA